MIGVEGLLREWLPQRRWFAGRGRRITAVGVASEVELRPVSDDGPGLTHLLLDVDSAGGASDRYQVLLGVAADPPVPVIGRLAQGPAAGLAVYEALEDPRLAGWLLARLGSPGRAGPLVFTAEPDAVIPDGLPPRVVSAEQSNSSVVYGESFILKVFRRVAPGVNPDLEVSRALARAGCARVPAPVAWFETLGLHEDPATLGLLQRFLPDAVEGWALALRSVAEGGDFTGAARELGAATAEVHIALARTLPCETLGPPALGLLATAMGDRLTAAVRAVPRLAPYEAGLRGAYEDLAALAERGAVFEAQRVHGDLHLGQVLRTPERGWVLIDFEGEPARPLSERRRPQLVAQDVAGMLRSFDYAARHRDPAAPDAAGWALAQRAAFCAGYALAGGRDPRDEPVPLRAFETDKAVYEVLYEARHRPEWLPIPMAAVRRLAAA
jgi:maltokinase